MEKNGKLSYETPALEVVIGSSEDVVCQSGEAPDMQSGWEWNL